MTGIFYSSVRATELWGYNISSKKAPRGTKKKINTALKISNFCANDSNLAENTKLWAMSNFNSSTNIGPLVTNDGALGL